MMTSEMGATATSTLRVATFNASLTGDQHVARNEPVTGSELFAQLATGDNARIRNVAEIIQRVRPDILLLNEFDYTPDPGRGVSAFRANYLQRSQSGAEPIDYPWFYTAPVNTGIDSGLDLDRDGIASGRGQDALGYGLYPGHYGMLLLSRYPIDAAAVRSFRRLLWRDMPHNLLQEVRAPDGEPWYDPAARAVLPLSSKSHWDVPVRVGAHSVHILASHPTPPVFDGPEDRNGKRNHDEIRFWNDYLTAGAAGAWIRDDRDGRGGFEGELFVIAGDLNASPVEGDAIPPAISSLLQHPRVQASTVPTSAGGAAQRPENPHAAGHTASFGLRVDYVLPAASPAWRVTGAGVFWPASDDPLGRLVRDPRQSSDHRLVWVDLEFQPLP
ncbi:endonuclease/exonuclease/phosphatase family protein [Haliea sp. E1-2-M8]|uniref:endonuclease/exonuclease/phosphatase family protein n=1 Tax=Haliea sp. E1-2-M8 TaxID=3064706 RepID=UPI0027256F13|nr:endonuclease/exonuclease/phosphatase family protein [Haliea sp. E1-2-M8]MDO8860560.1 endonuclease/exonuclease/phosphatase family protein [Haliea sp. E1-2-M8]